MARKHFDTLWIHGSLFNVIAPAPTPTAHNSASFRLRTIRANLPHRLSLDIWTGFGNGEKHAGDATPSTDERESVPTTDPTRSGRATRDGWQPVAVIDTDTRSAVFQTLTVDHEAHVTHVAGMFHADGYEVSGLLYIVPLFGARVERTTLSRTGVPYSPQFRNTNANAATHRDRARRNGSRLMEFGEQNGG